MSSPGSLVLALLGAFIFGAAALIGVMCALAILPRLKRFEDGPEPTAVNPFYLIGGAIVLGGFLAFRHIPMPGLLTTAVLAGVLVAIWYCDARTGIIPDVFTLVPLALVLIDAAFVHQLVQVLISAVVLFVPFALGALFSKGRGMGWGDAKLAALAGAMLGMMIATFSLGVASLIAVIITSIRHKSKPVPIAFAPYMIGAIVVGVAYKAL